eukprot:ANDGO_02245.mRNA.1 putative pre-mRNA-splicing factor ATP-dependent RNA helicase DEAH3
MSSGLKRSSRDDSSPSDTSSSFRSSKQPRSHTTSTPSTDPAHAHTHTHATNNPMTGEVYSSRYHELLATRKRLPVYEHQSTVLSLVSQNRATVIVGETGSGKTTQIPQFLALDPQFLSSSPSVPSASPHFSNGAAAGPMCVACTQPRRVAAMSVATRVAEEMDVELGTAVGYSVRFEDRSTPGVTRLKYLTDGMLLREAMFDPLLSRYSVIVIDEAHERTVATDILMGLLKGLLFGSNGDANGKGKRKAARPDLRVVVMSATLEARKFQEYFGGAPLLSIPGRMFPVQVVYAPEPVRDYFQEAVRTVLSIHRTEPVDGGDILLFLTGEDEIEDACRRLEGESGSGLSCLPLYSSLPPAQQQKVFRKTGPGVRKVIVATNIAETSITIDGVVFVVDPGFVKQKIFNPRTRVESLQVTPISQAAADQRKGRAGRTRPGKCYRMYTEASYASDLMPQSFPEILRTNLAMVVLQLKKIGVDDLVHFDFIDPPAPEVMMRALELLHSLGALDDDCNLTHDGHLLAEFPLDPQLSKMIVASPKFHCSNEAVILASMLSVQPPFVRPKEKDREREADESHRDFQHSEGDHLTLLEVYTAYKSQPRSSVDVWCRRRYLNPRSLRMADDICTQLVRLMQKLRLPLLSPRDSRELYASVQKTVIAGFFMQVAHLERAGFWMVVKDNQPVLLHPSTSITYKPEWVVYNEFVWTSQKYIRTVTAVSPEWLIEAAPHFFAVNEDFPEGEAKRILARIWKKVHDKQL